MRLLIENGLNPNTTDHQSRTPLHVASASGHVAVVTYLAQLPSIDINAEDELGATPLQDALRHRHSEVQDVLRKYGGNVGKMDVAAELCEAAACNDLATLQVYAKNSINLNSSDYDSRTALHLAASNGNLEVVSYLLRWPGIDVNPVDRKGGTPLDDAIRENKVVL